MHTSSEIFLTIYVFFVNDSASTRVYTSLPTPSLHDALPLSPAFRGDWPLASFSAAAWYSWIRLILLATHTPAYSSARLFRTSSISMACRFLNWLIDVTEQPYCSDS